MLFIQHIDIIYHKNVRYANYAQQRQAVKFCRLYTDKLPALENDEILYTKHSFLQYPDGIKLSGESYKLFDEKGLYSGKGYCNDYGGKIAVSKTENGYAVLYYLHKWNKYYFPKFELAHGEYGRISVHERSTYWDSGEWYYILSTYNFINDDASKLREKMFFKKQPEYIFNDKKYLRYS